MARLVAAIVAHPDDEVLACGGALALHAGVGDRVRILVLATGLAARREAMTVAAEHAHPMAAR